MIGEARLVVVRAVLIGAALASCCGVWAGLLLWSYRPVAGVVAVAFFGALAGFLLVSLWKFSASARARLAVVIISAGIGLLLVDIAIAWLPVRPPRSGPPRARPISLGDRVRDLREQGELVYPAIFPSFLLQPAPDGALRSVLADAAGEVLPLAGLAGVETLAFCSDDGEFNTRYRSDERGFQNPPGLWRRDEVEVLAVGDSFTHGVCVKRGEEFMSLIRERHPRTLNLGMPGNGPLLDLGTLLEYADWVRPRVVLWTFFEGNDLRFDLPRELRNPSLRRYLDGDTQGLRERVTEVEAVVKEYLERGLRGPPVTPSSAEREMPSVVTRTPGRRFVNLLLLRRLRERLDLTFGGVRDDVDSFARILTAAATAVRSWNGRLVLVYLPSPIRFLDARERRHFDATRDAVLAMARERGFVIAEVAAEMERRGDGGEFFPAGWLHFNPRGHALAAEVIAAAIRPLLTESPRSP